MVDSNACIGCQACIDMCPRSAIDFSYNIWGEGRALVDTIKCTRCGLYKRICPALNISFQPACDTVYATFSIANRNSGSSGGIFFELASDFIRQGGVVYGAAFDPNLKLIHTKATCIKDLGKLCKSKYLHSDMNGVYADIADSLRQNIKVMFVGTPCQVSAVKNLFSDKYKGQILLVDFLCHGTGTQKVFDICVKETEKNKNGKIVNFTFRAKSRRAEHSFSYTLRKGNKSKVVSGYSFEFPYYNSFLKYNIFNEYCYDCKYACNHRVGDITLGDFWNIQSYNKQLDDKTGTSMIAVNTETGKYYFDSIRSKCVIYQYPIRLASDNNQAFRENEGTRSRDAKHIMQDVLLNKGEPALLECMRCKNISKQIVYAKTPDFVKKLWNRVKRR